MNKIKTKMISSMPVIIEKGCVYDIPSRLLKERIVFLVGEIDEELSNNVISQLLYLESEDDNKPIHLYINSPGGSCIDGFAIYDAMQTIKAPVHTLCIGMACSMGAFLLAAGSEGKRKALPNSTIMIHQISSGTIGKFSEMEVNMKETTRIHKLIIEILAKHTGQSIKKLNKEMIHDNYMSPKQALDYNLIDAIVKPKK
jgi:ATP-dependent Clp protease protease subunit